MMLLFVWNYFIFVQRPGEDVSKSSVKVLTKHRKVLLRMLF